MTFAVLFLLIVIAWVLSSLRWRGTRRAVVWLTVIGFFAVGCGPVTRWLLDGLQGPFAAKTQQAWGQRNAIVLLGAGTDRIGGTDRIEPGMFAYARLVEAAQQYHACHVAGAGCRVVVTGGDARHTGVSEAVRYRDVLTGMGVAEGDILLEPNSMNTWQNAQFTAPLLKTYNADHVVLVTSGIHMRRSLLYFNHFGVAAVPSRADYLRVQSSWLPLGYNFAVADFALHEYVGIARYHVYNEFGWNPARTQPGQA